MAQALLVTTDRQVISRLTEALDEARLDLRIFVLAQFDEYPDPRFVLASPTFDQQRLRESYKEYGAVLKQLGVDEEELPYPLILTMDDPVIRALQQRPGLTESARGLHIGSQLLGDRYLEDGYVFRVRA